MLPDKGYLVKEEYTDGLKIAVCLLLCSAIGILNAHGRIPYTDNYSSVKLAKHLYENHGWILVGTISPTKKNHREKEDFIFSTLSNGTLNTMLRGWFQDAAINVCAPSGRFYYIQATTWSDKKQDFFN